MTENVNRRGKSRAQALVAVGLLIKDGPKSVMYAATEERRQYDLKCVKDAFEVLADTDMVLQIEKLQDVVWVTVAGRLGVNHSSIQLKVMS